MNSKVAKVAGPTKEAFNLISSKVKISAKVVLDSAITKKAADGFNPVKHKLLVILAAITKLKKKEFDLNLIKKSQDELVELVKKELTDKKHKTIAAAIMVALDYLLIKTLVKPIAKIVPSAIAKFTYITLAKGLTYAINKSKNLKVSQIAKGKDNNKDLKSKFLNVLKSVTDKASEKSIENIKDPNIGKKYLNHIMGAPQDDTSDEVAIEIGKLLFASAAASAFFEETSKRVSVLLDLGKIYFALFNAVEVAYYVLKSKPHISLKSRLISRLITVAMHGILLYLHKTKYKNLTYIFHALFNIYSPIIAVAISNPLKDNSKK